MVRSANKDQAGGTNPSPAHPAGARPARRPGRCAARRTRCWLRAWVCRLRTPRCGVEAKQGAERVKIDVGKPWQHGGPAGAAAAAGGPRHLPPNEPRPSSSMSLKGHSQATPLIGRLTATKRAHSKPPPLHRRLTSLSPPAALLPWPAPWWRQGRRGADKHGSRPARVAPPPLLPPRLARHLCRCCGGAPPRRPADLRGEGKRWAARKTQ